MVNELMLVCSMEPEEHRGVCEAMSDRFVARLVELRRDALRHFLFEPNLADRAPVILLCHLCEGRTTLTDADGLYNSFLVAAARAGGRVYLGLTGLAGHHSGLADDAVVDELVQSGQRAIHDIHASRRLLTWNETPTSRQIAHLARFADLPPFRPPPGVLAHAARDKPQQQQQQQQQRRAFCTIL